MCLNSQRQSWTAEMIHQGINPDFAEVCTRNAVNSMDAWCEYLRMKWVEWVMTSEEDDKEGMIIKVLEVER